MPIVQPTIDPNASPIAPEVEAATPADPAAVPPGLEALRPTPEPPAAAPSDPAAQVEVDRPGDVRPTEPDAAASLTADAIADERTIPSAQTAPDAAPATDGPGPAAPAIDEPRPAATDAATADQHVDRRRKVEDPTLFPVDLAVAPTRPRTSKAAYEDWDALMNRIAAERILVVRAANDRGQPRLDVPSLGQAEQALLADPRFARRTAGRLEAIREAQEREVDRLVRWMQTRGRDPEALVIRGRRARIEKAPASVKTLMRNWCNHPNVVATVRIENDRRVEAARTAPPAPATTAPRPRRGPQAARR